MPTITAHLDENEYRIHLNFKNKEPFINTSLLLRQLYIDYIRKRCPDIFNNKEPLDIKEDSVINTCAEAIIREMMNVGKELPLKSIPEILVRRLALKPTTAKQYWKVLEANPNPYGLCLHGGSLSFNSENKFFEVVIDKIKEEREDALRECSGAQKPAQDKTR